MLVCSFNTKYIYQTSNCLFSPPILSRIPSSFSRRKLIFSIFIRISYERPFKFCVICLFCALFCCGSIFAKIILYGGTFVLICHNFVIIETLHRSNLSIIARSFMYFDGKHHFCASSYKNNSLNPFFFLVYHIAWCIFIIFVAQLIAINFFYFPFVAMINQSFSLFAKSSLSQPRQ